MAYIKKNKTRKAPSNSFFSFFFLLHSVGQFSFIFPGTALHPDSPQSEGQSRNKQFNPKTAFKKQHCSEEYRRFVISQSYLTVSNTVKVEINVGYYDLM